MPDRFENGSADNDLAGLPETIGSSGSGFFNGSMDQNSPYAAFHGTGEVTIKGTSPVDDSGDSFATNQLFTRNFKFRGVRNATGTTTSSTTTSS
jgi:hypothetical protein